MGDAVAAFAGKDDFRIGKAAIGTHEGVTTRIKAAHRFIYGVYRIVIAALSVFRLMVEDTANNLYFPRRKVALKIGHIILRIPKAEFNKAEQIKVLRNLRFVGKRDAVYFAGIRNRNKGQQLRLYAILPAGDNCIAQTVPAFIIVQRGLRWLPARVPYGITIFNVIVASTLIRWAVIVAIAG